MCLDLPTQSLPLCPLECPDLETGKMMVTLPSTPYYLNYKALIDALDNHVIMTVIPFVTFVVVTVATAITIVRLRRVMTWRRKSASTCRRSSQVGLNDSQVGLNDSYFGIRSTPVLPQ